MGHGGRELHDGREAWLKKKEVEEPYGLSYRYPCRVL